MGMMCPGDNMAVVPSFLKPKTLVEYADARDRLPVDDKQATSVSLVPFRGGVDRVECNHELVESLPCLLQTQQGLHGLGDEEFGVSHAIVQHAVGKISGFVKNSQMQFKAEHSSVCQKENPFNIDDQSDLELLASCQKMCGRYCRRNIKDKGLFTNVIHMFKSVARMLSKKRDVKNGNDWYLSPTCKLPVLLIHSGADDDVYGRLVCRVSYKPLEVDFLHCKVQRHDDTYCLTISADLLEDSNHYCPIVDTMVESAIWLCQVSQQCAGLKCQIFVDYDMDEEHNDKIWLKPLHKSCSVDGVENIGQTSFESLLPNTKPSAGQDGQTDEDIAFSVAKQFLSRCSDKNQSKGTSRKQATAVSRDRASAAAIPLSRGGKRTLGTF